MSGKRVFLDTNVVIDLLAGDPKVLELLSEMDELLLPSQVVGELYYGAENSERKEHHIERIEAFLSRCRIISVDDRIAKEYGRVKRELKEKGTPIPENDVWIAATARTWGLPLLMSDAHFRGLELELWSLKE
jgi:tRNA(fMet)-specific endonuclease VapC